jgi:hypothetical protein
MFFVLVINDNGDGAKYWQSVELSFLSRLGTRATIEAPWPDIVAGILAHWVCIFPFVGLPFKTGPLTCGHGFRRGTVLQTLRMVTIGSMLTPGVVVVNKSQ